MKHFFTIPLTYVAMVAQLEASAAVLRVNALGYSANYTDLAVAIANAGDGDTIHLEPSSVPYGDVTIDRRLVIIGPGYKLGQSTADNPGLQASSQTSKVGGVVFVAGSGGSVLMGLHFTGVVVRFDAGEDDYVISRCYFDQGGIVFNNITPLSGVRIAQCYIHGGSVVGYDLAPQTNVTIANTYLYGAIEASQGFANDWSLSHNVFEGPGVISAWDAEISDNIFDTTQPLFVNNNSIHDNIARNAGILPVGQNNLNSVDLNLHFPAVGSDDGKWDFLANSSFNDWSMDGTDVGIYGGATPYKRSGIPAIPTIYELMVPPAAVQGEPVEVTLSTRSNN